MIGALAATTKLLAPGGPVTSLRFANRRTFTIEPDVSWLKKSKLTPNDRKQLIAILASYGGKPLITSERALTSAPEQLFTGELSTFAEHAIEWFDLLDQDDVVQFQLWLYAGGRGVLLRAATILSVATVAGASFAGAGSGLDVPTAERLAALLRRAKKIAANLHPGSKLVSTSF
jgi:hypothetical protein